MDYDVGIVKRRRIISADECYFAAPAAVLDAATIAWVAQVVTNGGTVSDPRKTIVNNLIVTLKSAGIWTKLDRLWTLAAENSQSALTDMVGLTLCTNNGATFTVDRGFTGSDGGTIFVDTSYRGSVEAVQYTQNSAHMSQWTVGNVATTAGGCQMGGVNTTNTSETDIFDTYLDGNVYGRINDVVPASGSQGSPGTRQGQWLANRDSSTTSQLYQNGSLFSSPNWTSGVLGNNPIAICAQHNTGAGCGLGSPNQIAMGSAGASLSATDVTNFYNALRTYMTAVGVP